MARKIVCQHEECDKFGILQLESRFYLSNYKLMIRLPICKSCINTHINLTKTNEVLGILQQLDYPYINDIWRRITKDYSGAILERYIAEIRKDPKTKNLHFLDACGASKNGIKLVDDDVTEDMRERFGTNFTNDELIAMEKKYRFLQGSFDEITTMHTESLFTFIRYRVKEEFATADNNVSDAKSWGALAKSAAIDCGITPNQLSKADLIGGITAFGELTQVVEENSGGVIPIMPEFLQRPRDLPDFTIYNYIDCARHLEGKEVVSYKQIYEFYDQRKQDFMEENEDLKKIFENDKPEEYRPKVEKFLKMPVDPSENQIGEMDG